MKYKAVPFAPSALTVVLIIPIVSADSLAESRAPTPSVRVTVSAQPTAKPAIAFTPPKLTEALHNETNLIALQFSRQSVTKNPLLNMKFTAERAVILQQISDMQYSLTIQSARVSTPLFTAPQIAPEDFEPFEKIQIREVVKKDAPIDLVVTIDLSRAALLVVSGSDGNVDIFEGND